MQPYILLVETRMVEIENTSRGEADKAVFIVRNKIISNYTCRIARNSTQKKAVLGDSLCAIYVYTYAFLRVSNSPKYISWKLLFTP